MWIGTAVGWSERDRFLYTRDGTPLPSMFKRAGGPDVFSITFFVASAGNCILVYNFYEVDIAATKSRT